MPLTLPFCVTVATEVSELPHVGFLKSVFNEIFFPILTVYVLMLLSANEGIVGKIDISKATIKANEKNFFILIT